MPPVALTIAGSDPIGGAGIQADLKTFHQFGVYGEAVITLIAVQNTTRAATVETLPAELVAEQLAAVLEDIPPAAAKTGALGSAEIVRAVVRLTYGFDFPLVIDPVMMGKQGATLLPEDAARLLERELMPRAALITPNLPEAQWLADLPIQTLSDMRLAATRLCKKGARAVLIKGGHLPGEAIDLLLTGGQFLEFPAARIKTRHTHGTGCTYSAAITAGLARGLPLADAVARAHRFIHDAIQTAPGLGHGAGPVNHHVEVR